MPKIKRNVIANYVGNGWTALMSLAFIPLYIRFMGIEAYGLVGFYATLLLIFSLLDLGISTTMSWHLARLSVQPEKAHEERNLVRTLEVIYWAIAIAMGALVYMSADWIANQYLRAAALSPATIGNALELIALTIVFRWPFGFYAAGLLGLQRQELYNFVRAGVETLRGFGAVLILWLVSPTLQAFFIWQVAVSIAGTLVLAISLWRKLPRSKTPTRFQFSLLRDLWRFSAAMGVNTVTLVISNQTDKIILSKVLTLDWFGYYTLASNVAAALYNLVSPISTALYPRFVQLVTLRDEAGLKQKYHRGCQLLSVLLGSAAIVLALFSAEVLELWTQDPAVAQNTYIVTSLLVVAVALDAVLHVPGSLQHAYGISWINFGTALCFVAILIQVPAIYFMAVHYGVIGAALTKVAVQGAVIPLFVHIQHRHILIGEKKRWYVEDFAMPVVAALLVAAAFRWLLSSHLPALNIPLVLTYLVGVSVATLCAAAIAAPYVRREGLALLRFRLLNR